MSGCATVTALRKPGPGDILIPWDVLLPDPNAITERITYTSTTDPTSKRSTRTAYRLYVSSATLVIWIRLAEQYGACPIALRNLRALQRP